MIPLDGSLLKSVHSGNVATRAASNCMSSPQQGSSHNVQLRPCSKQRRSAKRTCTLPLDRASSWNALSAFHNRCQYKGLQSHLEGTDACDGDSGSFSRALKCGAIVLNERIDEIDVGWPPCERQT